MIRVAFLKHPFHCGEERHVEQGKARKEGGCCWDAGEMMRTWEQGMELGRLREGTWTPGVGDGLEVGRTGE